MNKPQVYVLIVEDDQVDRMACSRALGKNADYEFVLYEAETGREGLQLAHDKKPDCVLLDLHLPDMTGLEFLAELKNELGEIPVPVMMLTGADNASVAVEAMKRGAQDYLVKDVNLQYLELLPAVIGRVLRERRILIEKKQMEVNLGQAEAKYRFLVEQIPAITYTAALDAPGKLLYISPQIRQLGFPIEEWLDDPEGLLKQVYPEDRVLVREAIKRGYESGEPLRCEYRVFTRTGEMRWFLNESSLVRDDSGNPLFLQGVLIDISRDKKVDDELQQHRQRLEELVAKRTAQCVKQTAIFESVNANLTAKLGECTQARGELRKLVDQFEDLYLNAPCAYCLLDPDGVFVQINEAGLKLLDRTNEEIVGVMRITDLLTAAGNEVFQESYQRLKESGHLHDIELDFLNKEGGRMPVLLSGNAIRDAAGRFASSRFVMFDLAESR
jgi:PAS domain S-box-containing protein